MTPEQRDDLLAVYAVERQDDSNALTVAFAITTTALTYVIAATAYFAAHCGRASCDEKTPVWLPLAAPSIAITFVGFLVLNVAASRMRSVHLQRIENHIRIPLPRGYYAPSFHSDAGLIYRPDHPGDKPRIRWIFAGIAWICYPLIIAALMGFTWVILIYMSGSWTVGKTVVSIVYGIFELIEALGFLVPLLHQRFKYVLPAKPLPH
jgi:hypothetical protein